MDIADDVKWAVFVLQVVPQRLTFDFCGVNIFGRMQYMDSAKAFPFKVPQRPAQLLRLLAYDMGTKRTVWTITVSLVTKLFRQIENNGDRNTVKLPSEGNDRLAGFSLHVRGVDHYQLAGSQPFGSDEIKNLKRVIRGRLAVLLVGHEATAEVRRKNLSRSKMLSSKARLARSRGTDESDNCQLWNRQLHWWVKIPICVGLPTIGSSGPTGRNRTE